MAGAIDIVCNLYTPKAGGQPQSDAKGEADRHGAAADEQRDAASERQPAHQVTAEEVGA